ncbi:hypothetical protein [Micromonospora sp. NPDC048839]|uniref:hypothetical protein n=1 Tax=Micromonospora sp. NPDC048839 TaxID=3155641 RepID=UPI0033FC6A64
MDSIGLLPFLVSEEGEPGQLGQRQDHLRVLGHGVLLVELPGSLLPGDPPHDVLSP